MATLVYLSTNAADSAISVGAGTKKQASLSLPGGSATISNINTVLGSTAGVQFTDSVTVGTNGTAISWYTKPLGAVTIAGQITWTMFAQEAATANNSAVALKIERCSGDGTVLSTIVAVSPSQGALETATTAGGATKTGTITAGNTTDTTLSDGDRLRITVWIDDAADQGGTGTMASGGNSQIWYGANTGQGLASVTFTEALTSYLSVTALLPAATLSLAPTSANLFADDSFYHDAYEDTYGLSLPLAVGARVTAPATISATVSGWAPIGGFTSLGTVGVGLTAQANAGASSRAIASSNLSVSAPLEGGSLLTMPTVGVSLVTALTTGSLPTALASLTATATGRLDAAARSAALATSNVTVTTLLVNGSTAAVSTVGVSLVTALLAGASPAALATSALAVTGRVLAASWLSANVSVVGPSITGSLWAGSSLRTLVSANLFADDSFYHDAYEDTYGLSLPLAVGTRVAATATQQVSITGAAYGGESALLTTVGIGLSGVLPAATTARAMTSANISVTTALPVAELVSATVTSTISTTGRLLAACWPNSFVIAVGDVIVAGNIFAGSLTRALVTSDLTTTVTGLAGAGTAATIIRDGLTTGLTTVGLHTMAGVSQDALVTTALLAAAYPSAVTRIDLPAAGTLLSGPNTASVVTITVTSSGLLVIGSNTQGFNTADLNPEMLIALGSGIQALDVTSQLNVITTGIFAIGAWLRATLFTDHGHPTGSSISHGERTTLASHERTTVVHYPSG